MAADSAVVEDANGVPVVDESDDSYIKHTVDSAADDNSTPDLTGPVVDVKREHLLHVKTEDAYEHDMANSDISVKVRFFVFLFDDCTVYNVREL